MKANYLLPYRLKIIGWILFVPSAIMGLYTLEDGHSYNFFDTKVLSLVYENSIKGDNEVHNLFFEIVENNILDELLLILTILSALCIAFSKEKQEDELIPI